MSHGTKEYQVDGFKIKGSVIVPHKEGYVLVRTGRARLLDMPGGCPISEDRGIVSRTARREAKEEIGRNVKIERFLGNLMYRSPTSGRLVDNHIFVSRELKSPPRILRKSKEEILEIVIADFEEILEFAEEGELRYPALLEAFRFYEENPNYPYRTFRYKCNSVPSQIFKDIK